MDEEILDEVKKLRNEVEKLKKDYIIKSELLLGIHQQLFPPNNHDWHTLRFNEYNGVLSLGEKGVDFKRDSIEKAILKTIFFKSGKAKKRQFTIAQIEKSLFLARYEVSKEQIRTALKRIMAKSTDAWKRSDIFIYENDKFSINSTFSIL